MCSLAVSLQNTERQASVQVQVPHSVCLVCLRMLSNQAGMSGACLQASAHTCINADTFQSHIVDTYSGCARTVSLMPPNRLNTIARLPLSTLNMQFDPA
jgi:hypothetical protein